MEYNKLMKGLKLIRISIIISIVLILLGGIRNFIFMRLITSSIFWDHYRTIFRVYDIAVYIGLIGSTIALIISGVGLYNIKKDSQKIGEAHAKDIRWAIILFWITLSISIASWLRILTYRFFPMDNLFVNVVVVPTFFEFLFWISIISMILLLLLPLRKIAGNDQKKLGLIFALGRIIIPVFWGLFFFIVLITKSLILARIFSNDFFTLFISFLSAFIFFLIFRAYHETIMDLSGRKFRSLGKVLKLKVPFKSKLEKGLSIEKEIYWKMAEH